MSRQSARTSTDLCSVFSPRLLRRATAGATFVLLFVAGCGASTDTAGPTGISATSNVTPDAEMEQWEKSFWPVHARLSVTLGLVGRASLDFDVAATHRACRELDDASQMLSDVLPSPDRIVDKDLISTVDHFREVSRQCLQLNPITEAGFVEIRPHIDQAVDGLNKAVRRLDKLRQSGKF